MSILLVHSNRVTDMFISGLYDVIRVVDVVGDDRTAANDGGGIAGLVDDACLLGELFFDG